MVMTLTDMQTEVRANVHRTSDVLPNSRITTWLNWAQQLVSDWHTYEEMRKYYTGSTVSGRKMYGFPTNMKDVYSLTLQDGVSSRKLVYVNPREFDSKVPRPEQTTGGLSSYYVDYGLNFELYRIPNKVYVLNLRCSIYPINLINSSDTSALLRKDALLCAVATMFGFLSLREVEDATYWKAEFVAPLFQASLASDHSAEDWVPVARGFDTCAGRIGEYHSNPLIRSMP